MFQRFFGALLLLIHCITISPLASGDRSFGNRAAFSENLSPISTVPFLPLSPFLLPSPGWKSNWRSGVFLFFRRYLFQLIFFIIFFSAEFGPTFHEPPGHNPNILNLIN